MLLAFSFAVASGVFVQQVLFVFLGVLLFVLVFLRKTTFSRFLRKVSRVSYGEFFFVFGVMIALLITGGATHLFQLSMVVLALAVPFAFILGMQYGAHEYAVRGELRSFEGSVACGLISAGIFLMFGYSIVFACIAGVILAVVEAFSCRGSDNFSLPLTTVLLAFFFS